jgi:WD40 repeat protein
MIAGEASLTVLQHDRLQEPWLGLESYSERDAELFYGREAETDELFRLLRREALTVVFGASGTGKTSLLKAGLFPKLRDEHFLPVPVRLEFSEAAGSLSEQVRSAMARSLEEAGIEETFSDAAAADTETLWEYLHRTFFWDSRNNPVIPVIIFDQFEEIFTLGQDQPATRKFLVELADIVENYIPESVRLRLERHGSKLGFDASVQDYKVLIALREDYVSRLDRLRKRMPSVMHNRFALTRMDGRQAMRPVLLPGHGIVSEPVAEQIVRKVASADPQVPLERLVVDPALLSLMCRELNGRRMRERLHEIEAGLVNNAAADILDDFYERSFNGLNPLARVFVEDRLLTSDGFRTIAALDAAIHSGLGGDMEALVNRRLIRTEERLGLPHLELTHDVLTKIAFSSRKERQERQRRAEDDRRKASEESARRAQLARTRLLLLIVGAAGLVCLGLAVFAFNSLAAARKAEAFAKSAESVAKKAEIASNVAANIADQERRRTEKALNDTTLAEEAARKAQTASESANSSLKEVQRLTRNTSDIGAKSQLSLLLSVHASAVNMKVDGSNSLGPIDVIRQQLRTTGGLPLLGHDAATGAAAFSADRQWLATASADGRIRLWNVDDFHSSGRSILVGEHRGLIRGLAFSPDSKWLASGGAAGSIRFWRIAAKGATPGPLFDHSAFGRVLTIAFSPNGQWFVFGTEKGHVCVWKMSADGPAEASCDVGKQEKPVNKVLFSEKGRWLATAQILDDTDAAFTASISLWDASDATFPNRVPKRLLHAGPVPEDALEDFTFSVDESRLAVSYGYEAQVWDLTQQQPPDHVIARANHAQWIMSIGLSPDNRWLATGSIDTNVKLWDLTANNKPPVVLEGHSATVRSVTFSRDARWFVTAGDDAVARLWDLSGPVMSSRLLRGQDRSIRQMLFSPDADYVLALGADAHARLWSIPDPTVDPIVLRGQTGGGTIAAVSPDGTWIASSAEPGHKILLWSPKKNRRPVHQLQLPSAAQAIAFSADGRWLAALTDEPTGKGQQHVAYLWTLADLSKKPFVLDNNDSAGPASFGFSPDSRWLLSGTWNNRTLNIWDVAAGNPAALPRFRCRQDAPVRALAFSRDGHFAVSGSHGYQAYLWDLTAADPCASRRSYGQHGDVVAGVAISPDSRWIATASFDRKGRVWDLKSGARVAEAQFHDRSTEVAFSPDGRSVAFGAWDRSVQVLDLKTIGTSKPIAFPGHDGRVFAVAFTPDSRWLVTAGEDRTIRIWDRSDAGAAPIVLRHEGSVSFLAFVNDGNWLVSSGADGTVRLWRLLYNDLVDVACRTAGRQLTPKELADFLGSKRSGLPCMNQPAVD